MTRKRKDGGLADASQAVKAAQKEQRRLNKQSRELLRKAGKDIRQVRSEVARLKKVGIISQRINAAKYVPTRYMLSKLKKNADILSGESVALKATKAVRKKYQEKDLFDIRGQAIIVPKDYADQKTRIKRGLIEITRPLKKGEEVRLILPFRPIDMEQVAERLKTDPTLDGLKNPNELFGFRMFGHNMATIGFPDAQELGDYIQRKYLHLFSGPNRTSAVKNFVLFRFRSGDSQMNEAPKEGKIYHPYPERDNTWALNRRRERDKKNKQKRRKNETQEQREKRLSDQRKRTARNRQRKFDES